MFHQSSKGWFWSVERLPGFVFGSPSLSVWWLSFASREKVLVDWLKVRRLSLLALLQLQWSQLGTLHFLPSPLLQSPTIKLHMYMQILKKYNRSRHAYFFSSFFMILWIGHEYHIITNYVGWERWLGIEYNKIRSDIWRKIEKSIKIITTIINNFVAIDSPNLIVLWYLHQPKKYHNI